MDKLKLVLPNKKYLKSWQSFLRENIKANHSGRERLAYEKQLQRSKEDGYFRRLYWDRIGKNLDKGLVAQIIYFGIVDNKVIGRIALRPHLDKQLKVFGGHIGYVVRPSKQGKGYATEMLLQVLRKAKKFGLKKVLLTCDADNIASRKVIEKAGGILTKEFMYNGVMICYYIIEIK